MLRSDTIINKAGRGTTLGYEREPNGVTGLYQRFAAAAHIMTRISTDTSSPLEGRTQPGRKSELQRLCTCWDSFLTLAALRSSVPEVGIGRRLAPNLFTTSSLATRNNAMLCALSGVTADSSERLRRTRENCLTSFRFLLMMRTLILKRDPPNRLMRLAAEFIMGNSVAGLTVQRALLSSRSARRWG